MCCCVDLYQLRLKTAPVGACPAGRLRRELMCRYWLEQGAVGGHFSIMRLLPASGGPYGRARLAAEISVDADSHDNDNRYQLGARFDNEVMMSDSSVSPRPVRRQQRHLTVRDGRVSSSALLDESGLLWIQHQGDLYQLRRTGAGKLILTK